jgi:hypothetical protein
MEASLEVAFTGGGDSIGAELEHPILMNFVFRGFKRKKD